MRRIQRKKNGLVLIVLLIILMSLTIVFLHVVKKKLIQMAETEVNRRLISVQLSVNEKPIYLETSKIQIMGDIFKLVKNQAITARLTVSARDENGFELFTVPLGLIDFQKGEHRLEYCDPRFGHGESSLWYFLQKFIWVYHKRYAGYTYDLPTVLYCSDNSHMYDENGIATKDDSVSFSIRFTSGRQYVGSVQLTCGSERMDISISDIAQ